jgi:uncharacterized protein
VRTGIEASEVIASSRVAFVEARAAFARRRRAGHLSSADHRRLVHDFGNDWERYLKVDLAEPIILKAAELAERHGLRAYDAIHLASALTVREHMGTPPTFACWDRDLNAAAASEGLTLLRRG